MKAKTFEEWKKIYNEKTGDNFAVPPGFRAYYLPERGFAIMKADFASRMVMISEVCGDGKFWRDTAEVLIANSYDFDYIGSICTRRIEPYLRAFNGRIIDSQCVDGKYRYLAADSLGRPVLFTYMCEGQGKHPETPQYWVTHYLKEMPAKSIDELINRLNKRKEAIERGSDNNERG